MGITIALPSPKPRLQAIFFANISTIPKSSMISTITCLFYFDRGHLLPPGSRESKFSSRFVGGNRFSNLSVVDGGRVLDATAPRRQSHQQSWASTTQPPPQNPHLIYPLEGAPPASAESPPEDEINHRGRRRIDIGTRPTTRRSVPNTSLPLLIRYVLCRRRRPVTEHTTCAWRCSC